MASSVLNDEQLRLATQVAYKDFDINAYCEKQGLDASRGLSEGVCLGDVCPEGSDTWKELNSFGTDWQNWKIVDVCDRNGTTGFYGCVIDTGDGNAVVAFRGSEGMDNPWNLATDWIGNDFSMLSEIATPQQIQAAEYAHDLAARGVLNDYQHICSTGHSLGGNLSDAFTLAMTNHPDVWTRYDGSTNFDGPGFNAEFLIEHASEIEIAASRMTHYRWSVVGACLLPIPGAEPIDLETKPYDEYAPGKADGAAGDVQAALYDIAGKHDVRSLVFEDGSAKRAEGPTALNEGWNTVTEIMAFLPQSTRRRIVAAISIACTAFEMVKWIKDAVVETATRIIDTLVDVADFVISGVVQIGSQVFEWGKGVVVGAVNGVKDFAEGAWNAISNGAQNVWNSVQQGAAAVGAAVCAVASWGGGFMEWLGFPSGSSSTGGWGSSGDYGGGAGYFGAGYYGAAPNGSTRIDANGVLAATSDLWKSFALIETCFGAVALVENCLNLLSPFGWFYLARSNLGDTRRLLQDIEQNMRDLISSVEASVSDYQNLERALVLACSSFN